MGTLAEPRSAVRPDEPAPPARSGWIERIANALALAAALFHIYTAATAPLPAMQHRVVHLALGLLIVFLLHPTGRRPRRVGLASAVADTMLIALTLGSGIFLFVNADALLRKLSPDTLDVIVAFVLTGLVLEGTRRTTGWVLPLLGLIAIGYAFFGDQLSGLFQHTGVTAGQIARNLVLSTEGVLGVAIGVSATYVVLFVIFGALLQLSGAGSLVLRLSELTAGRFRGGDAKAATIASGLFGSISGSPVGNVAATGPVTIPMMRRAGFPPKTAGAVEAAASTGGMIMPPVMGATAFLIAEILSIPYADVVKAALIPAVLYYVALLMTIDGYARRLGLRGTKTERALRALGSLLLMRGYQLLPLAVLIYMLIAEGTTAARAAYWGLALAALISLVAALVSKRGRQYPKDLALALIHGFRSMLVIIMACATAGIVMGMLAATGLGFRLSYILTEISGSNLAVLMLLTMVASIILGMSLPAVAAYLVLAVTVAPALADLGVMPLAAHLFVFYFGVLSNITPPVALAAFTAAGIADARPNATGLEAVKFALSGFLIPFLFVISPALLLTGETTDTLIAAVPALIGLLLLSAAVAGAFLGQLAWLPRLLLAAAGVAVAVPHPTATALGAVLLAVVIVLILVRKRKETH